MCFQNLAPGMYPLLTYCLNLNLTWFYHCSPCRIRLMGFFPHVFKEIGYQRHLLFCRLYIIFLKWTVVSKILSLTCSTLSKEGLGTSPVLKTLHLTNWPLLLGLLCLTSELARISSKYSALSRAGTSFSCSWHWGTFFYLLGFVPLNPSSMGAESSS